MNDNTFSTASVGDSSGDLRGRIFTSLVQCSAATGVSTKILRQAKKLGLPGFTGSSRVVWDELEPALKKNQTIVENLAEDNIEFYKKEIAKRDVVLRDLQIQKIKEEMISPDELKSFLTKFGTLLSSVIKKKNQDLRSKCTGYEGLVDKEFVDIFNCITKELEQYE